MRTLTLDATSLAALVPSGATNRGLHVLASGGSVSRSMIPGTFFKSAYMSDTLDIVIIFRPTIPLATWTALFPDSIEVQDIT